MPSFFECCWCEYFLDQSDDYEMFDDCKFCSQECIEEYVTSTQRESEPEDEIMSPVVQAEDTAMDQTEDQAQDTPSVPVLSASDAFVMGYLRALVEHHRLAVERAHSLEEQRLQQIVTRLQALSLA